MLITFRVSFPQGTTKSTYNILKIPSLLLSLPQEKYHEDVPPFVSSQICIAKLTSKHPTQKLISARPPRE